MFMKNLKKFCNSNGGISKVGIESTVIDLTSYSKILRPGRIDKNSIEKLLVKKLIKYL